MELGPAEVAAIINHERTSWGNNASTVTEEEIKKIMDFVKLKAQ
jgi:cytochrome c oxidase cbb3-type subunit 2